jgi:hypothetical protein
MKVHELRSFLIRSKISSYASGKEGTPTDSGRREFVFEEKNFRYSDRYSGFNPFIGEEIVFLRGRLLWGMNYYGVVSGRIVSPKAVYGFLREALGRIEEQRPLRGPSNYACGYFNYVNRMEGTITRFRGTEKIFYKGRKVYTLFYHGGLLQSQRRREKDKSR